MVYLDKMLHIYLILKNCPTTGRFCMQSGDEASPSSMSISENSPWSASENDPNT